MNAVTDLKQFLRSTEARILFLLLGLGAAARIYGAWCLRHNLNLDAGVVALMAKHISEGTSFPVFFYGQAYMGSLEAFVSAFFMKAFGLYGFGATLGTAFVFFLLLPVLYVWARDIGGPKAGFAAVLFCMVGSWPFFYYGVHPRGGYAACLLFGALALWMSSRIADRTLECGLLPRSWLFVLGVAAGLGWWSNQLITAALVASALLLLIVLGRLVFSGRLLLGFAGFFLGSLPFWVYNIRHGWPTFSFSGSFGQVSFLHGLKLFFVDRFFSLTGLDHMHPAVAATGGLLYLAAVFIGLTVMVRAMRQNSRRVWISLLALYLFLFITALVFSTSHFAVIGDARYLLPVFPCLAILLGTAVSFFSGRLPWGAAWIPLLALVTLQYQAIVWAGQREASERALQHRIDAVSVFLEDHHISAVYTHKSNRAWTFATGERIIFGELWGDFYMPNARRVELTDNPAVLGDYGEVANFLDVTSGTARGDVAGDFLIHHDFAPPARGLREIPVESWASIRNMTGQEVTGMLANPVHPRSWFSPRRPHEDYLEIAFHNPVVVSGLRMMANARLLYPRFLQIEALPEGKSEWVVIHEASGTGVYFWSGNRPYPFGSHYRLEAFFEPVSVDRLRLVNKADIDLRRDFRWAVQFLQFFSPGPELPPEEDSLPLLLHRLDERGIRHLYADRWAANSVFKATQGRIWTPRCANLFPDSRHPLEAHVDQHYLLPKSPDEVMLFNTRTALLARQEDAPLIQRCLEHADIDMRQETVGPWALFSSEAVDEPDDGFVIAGLHWTGFGCIPSSAPANSRSVDTRLILPEQVGDGAFFYEDNWTTGDARISGLRYRTSGDDRYVRLRLKSFPPHGNDADTLGLAMWVNRTRLPLVRQDGLDFYFWLGWGFERINEIRVQSRTFVPRDMHLGDDPRTLGLMVESLGLTGALAE